MKNALTGYLYIEHFGYQRVGWRIIYLWPCVRSYDLYYKLQFKWQNRKKRYSKEIQDLQRLAGIKK